MIENIIKEELLKNKVLNNYSYKISDLELKKFSGIKDYEIHVKDKLCNGYIIIEVNTTSNFKVYYGDVLIFNTNTNRNSSISILFSKNKKLLLVGDCDSVKISIFGGNIQNPVQNYLIPKLNKFIEFNGTDNIMSFGSIDDLKIYNFTRDYNFSDLLCAQVVKLNGNDILACLYFDGMLKLCTGLDNYATTTIVSEDIITSAIKNLEKEITGLNIVYYHNGYFDNDEEIYNELNRKEVYKNTLDFINEII